MSYIRYPSTGGVQTYSSLAAFPASATNGALALALDTYNLYVFEVPGGWTLLSSPGADGDVFGPASSTDNALARFDGVTGKLIQNSNAILSDAGALSLASTISATNFSGSSSGTNTGDVTLGTANGLSLVGQALSLALSSGSTTGALSSTDWNTFNNKQNALTLGNLTAVGTDGIAVTGGTGAVVGSGTSIAQQASSATLNGYLSSTDWSTFNAKQPAGSYITALTGDVSASGPGSAAATVNSVGGQSAANVATATALVNGSGVTSSELQYLANNEPLTTASLADNQVAAADVATWAFASFTSIQLDYSIARGAGNRESGRIVIATDGSTAGFAQDFGSIGSSGVTFSVDISGATVRLRYTSTSTGTAPSMKYKVQKWLA